MANSIPMPDFLEDLRFAWGPDKHAVNHFGDHVWFKSIPGGYTECCEYGNECEHHKSLRNVDRHA